MKNKKVFWFTILCCILFSSSAFSQRGWIWQNPTPFGAYSYSTCSFINSNTGWMSNSESIIKTTNGGITWSKVISQQEKVYTFVQFINEFTGYTAPRPRVGSAGSGKYLKSTNGGNDWTVFSLPDTTFLPGYLYFANESTGFITGINSGFQDKMYRTSNGGVSWSVQSLTEATTYIKLFNSTDGILFCPVNDSAMKVYKTSNSGINWIPAGSLPNEAMLCASFIDINTGWVAGDRAIWKTTNGGMNWINQLSNPSLSFYDIQFANAQTGYVCGADGKIFKTTNGGTNWNLQAPSSNYYLYTIAVTDINTVFAGGEYGKIVKSSDGGNTWNNMINSFSDNYWFGAQALSSSIIYLTGAQYVNTNGQIAKSFNGGATWELAQTTITMPDKIQFFNQQTGWVAGNGLAKTTNGGISWQNHFNTNYVSSLFFLNESTGWIHQVGNTYATTNGGTNWNLCEYLNETFSDMFFINALTGYAFTYSSFTGKIFKSTNGGLNWNSISTGNYQINSAFCINELTGWTASGSMYIGKTTNGGVNWTRFTTNTSMNKIKFINSFTGWAVGEEAIYNTTDGGTSWNLQTPGDFGGLTMSALDFADANTGWVGGRFGAVLKTTTGGNVFISQTSAQIPEKYSLYQNYPNPFNPSTTIKFDIHKSDMASLKVFDLLGKEVKTLVNEQLSAGTYEVTLNAASLSSGIYFYVLKTGDFVESKRMILVK